jgi:hypothetical protein
MSTAHKEYADGLRALADFVEQHPEFPVPTREINQCSLDTKEEAAALARALGKCDKQFHGDIFIIAKDFGGVKLRALFYRDKVCKREKVGVKTIPEQHIPAREAEFVPAHTEDVYEWRCPGSLLGDEEAKAAAATSEPKR